jgi:hypothetical protein
MDNNEHRIEEIVPLAVRNDTQHSTRHQAQGVLLSRSDCDVVIHPLTSEPSRTVGFIFAGMRDLLTDASMYNNKPES